MNDLVVVENLTPAVVYAPGGVNSVLDKIKTEARAFTGDISTEKGRNEIKSFAYKIARSKTLLDDMGKDLVADLKKQTGAVDAERKRIRDELDKLKDEIRAPLTQWEQAEKDRVAEHETGLAEIAAFAIFSTPEPAIDEIANRIERIRGDNRDWQEFTARADAAKQAALTTLHTLKTSREAQEAERAELARLRKEQEERERREREEKLKAEAAEKARKEAEERAARERREAEEKAERERQESERQRLAAEKARQEAEERAKQAELDRIAAENKARADAEAAAAKAEQDRKEAAERAAQKERERIEAEQKAEADAAAKREADKKHRAKINNEALAGLVAVGLSEEQGVAVVQAITKGQVPNVKIFY